MLFWASKGSQDLLGGWKTNEAGIKFLDTILRLSNVTISSNTVPHFQTFTFCGVVNNTCNIVCIIKSSDVILSFSRFTVDEISSTTINEYMTTG